MNMADTIHPMTVGQQALWALGKLAANDSFGNLCTALRLSLSVDVRRLEATLAVLYARHDILRARLVSGDAAVQCIAIGDVGDMVFVARIGEGWDEADRDAWIEAEARRPFDLARHLCRFALLMRTPVWDEGPPETTLLIIVHHIIGDFRSIEILTQELEALYRGGAAGAGAPEPGSAQFLDYARHEPVWLASREAEQQARFWKERLSSLGDQRFPSRCPRRTHAVFLAIEHRDALTSSATEMIRSAARVVGITPFTFMLSVFGVTLAALTQHSALAVGTTVDLRRDRSLRRAVGYLVNTVPVVLRAEPAEPFATYALSTARSIAASMLNGKLPFARIARQSSSRHGAIQPFALGALFTWLKFEPEFGAGGPGDRLILDTLRQPQARLAPSSHALTLSIEDRRAAIECLWALDTESFAPDFGQQLSACFSELAARAAADLTQPVSTLLAIASDSLAPSDSVMETLEL